MNMNQDEKEYDEIDLMDYIKVIFKRKWLIFAVFALSVMIAGIVSFYLPKVYRIDTSLEIGKTITEAEEAALENPEQVVEKIKGDIYGISTKKELEISEKDYPKIKVNNPKGTNLIKMEIDSGKTEEAKAVLREINKLILEEHRAMTEFKKKFIEDSIESLKNKILLVEENIKNTENKVQPIDNDIERVGNKIIHTSEEEENLEAKIKALQEVLVYEQTPGTQFALFNAKGELAAKKRAIEDLYLRINSLERTKEDLSIAVNSFRKNIESLNTQINSLIVSSESITNTKIIKIPTISENSVSPKPLLNIALAGILGVFVGTFFAFFKEWWERNK